MKYIYVSLWQRKDFIPRPRQRGILATNSALEGGWRPPSSVLCLQSHAKHGHMFIEIIYIYITIRTFITGNNNSNNEKKQYYVYECCAVSATMRVWPGRITRAKVHRLSSTLRQSQSHIYSSLRRALWKMLRVHNSQFIFFSLCYL